jgi:cysteine desulfurase/selenocysteine lyase
MNPLIADYPIDRIRGDFPILATITPSGAPLTYLDSAATSQKPRQMVERLSRFYLEEYGTVRRGVYSLSQAATGMYEGVRAQCAAFVGAADASEIVFVRGVTEGMNLVANAWGRANLRAGDHVLVTRMEHHSSIVPWQLVCEATGAELKAVNITPEGELDLEHLRQLLQGPVKVVSVVHVSNGLGTVNPIEEIARMAHDVGAVVVVDGAQSAPHLPIDVQALGADFYAVSGHKMLGPTGIGFLYGRAELLSAMPPWQGGGEMIDRVTMERSTWEEPPWRFEAGTPAFAQVVGLGAAIDYMNAIGRERIAAWDEHLLGHAMERLSALDGIRFYGQAPHRSGIVSFGLKGIHPLDIGTMLDQLGICVRVGQHCVQPVMDYFGVPATVRASFGPYTNTDEIDRLVAGLREVQELLA